MASQGLLLRAFAPCAISTALTSRALGQRQEHVASLGLSHGLGLTIGSAPFHSLSSRVVRKTGSQVQKGAGGLLRVCAVAASEAVTSQEVEFRWQGDAGKVFVTGSFGDWKEKIPLEEAGEGLFTVKQTLPAGTYEYKFIVDDTWVHTLDKPTKPDGAGGFNNVLEVTGGSAEVKPKPKAAPKAKAAPAKAEAAPAKAEAEAPADAEAAAEEAAPKAKAAPPAAKAAKAAGKVAKAGGKKAAKAAAKPLPELMAEDVIPQLAEELSKQNVTDVELTFEDNQLRGCFVNAGVPYCFWGYFPDGELEGTRGFALTSHGLPPSTVEPFFSDEKRMTPEMLVFWVSKRLFAQKTALPKLN